MQSPINNITENYQQLYFPKQALVFYEHVLHPQQAYIEKFDCNAKGRLINAHPLSERELQQLAELFQRESRSEKIFSQCTNLLPENLLYLNAKSQSAIWYTLPGAHKLYFTKSLNLPDGKIHLPSLIWKATADDLTVFAVKTSKRPTSKTKLFHAPFFNIHDNGTVCMGTVDVDMELRQDIEEFIDTWQSYFFNSKFSHVINDHNCTKSPIHQLYQRLLNQPQTFPGEELIPAGLTLQHLL